MAWWCRLGVYKMVASRFFLGLYGFCASDKRSYSDILVLEIRQAKMPILILQSRLRIKELVFGTFVGYVLTICCLYIELCVHMMLWCVVLYGALSCVLFCLFISVSL